MTAESKLPAERALDEIRTAAHWYVRIIPPDAKQRFASPGKCLESAQQCAVSFRGWDYPETYDVRDQLSNSYAIQRGWDYRVHWEGYFEAWRFMQSGQFVHAFRLREDGEEIRSATAAGSTGKSFSLENTVATCTEIMEFASRLTGLADFAPGVEVEVDVNGLQGRRVVAGFNRGLHRTYISQVDQVAPRRFLAVPHESQRQNAIAVEMAVEILGVFGFDVSPQVLGEIQANFIARKSRW